MISSITERAKDLTPGTSHHSRHAETQISCGVHMLYGLSYMAKGVMSRGSPEHYIIKGLSVAVDPQYSYAFILFSDNDIYKNGIALASYIQKHGLGQIVESAEVKINPNSSNPIRVWTWAPDFEKTRAHIEEYLKVHVKPQVQPVAKPASVKAAMPRTHSSIVESF